MLSHRLLREEVKTEGMVSYCLQGFLLMTVHAVWYSIGSVSPGQESGCCLSGVPGDWIADY